MLSTLRGPSKASGGHAVAVTWQYAACERFCKVNKDWGATLATPPASGILKEANRQATEKEQTAKSCHRSEKFRQAVKTEGSEIHIY